MRLSKGRMLRQLIVLAMMVVSGLACAGTIQTVRNTLTTADDGSTELNADFAIDLGPRLEDAVSRGVPLYFTLELELTRPRWWWSNEAIVSKSWQYRLSYAVLTRQYRLSTGNLHRNFGTLSEALRVLSHFLDLHIADKGVLKFGETYNAGLRMSLDRSQLPKPLQVDAIADRDWQIDTRVLRWTYVPAAYVPPPAPPAPPPPTPPVSPASTQTPVPAAETKP